MRRLIMTLLTASLLGSTFGCCHSWCHTHGVCDCVADPEPCLSRAPWTVSGNPAPDVVTIQHVGEVIKSLPEPAKK